MNISVNPYLNFNGNAEEAFNFYRNVFGGEFINIQRFKDAPGDQVPGEENRIMHIALALGKNNILMASDTSAAHGPAVTGSNVQLSLGVSSTEEADRVYNGLSAGGKATMPMAKTFWGAYFGMCTDKFGIHWMVSFDEKND